MKSDHELEQLLRKAPAPAAPFGLEQRLIQQASRPRPERAPAWGWFALLRERNWAPALGLFVVMAGLLTVLAVQENTLSELKQTQEKLAAQVAPQTASAPAPAQGVLEQEIQELRKQSAELQALRTEMAEIEKLLSQLPDLIAQNQALRAELSNLTRNNPALSPEFQEALANARQKAERIKCVNNLKNIGLAARIWATDNGDQQHLPLTFVTMKNELSTPKILICPSDPGRSVQTLESWEQFTATGSSYELLSPGVPEQIPSAVYARCPFHNNVGMADGSVLQLQPGRTLVQRDGYWEVAP